MRGILRLAAVVVLGAGCAHGARAARGSGGVPGGAQGGALPAPQPFDVSDTAWHAAPWGGTPLIRMLVGDYAQPGPFSYYYRTPATTSLGAHRHTVDMHIRVVVGRQYILMGPDLESARPQWFDAGRSFVIPAGTWHVEWFETNTLVEISGIGPMTTERATAATPRRR